ncbi:hypothetical protein BD289DRAFT_482172 [Coniella lustricola]|uniref:BRCT domain-containing protein n=1 Tax=Coniella lustricola TaxID=2025994 RepID=A0A2T3A9P8_9PEZI|nr:hypothetical protein BD289DRAFT_482172 [Coniella lustricola]
MTPPRRPVPKAAEPKYGRTFDPWNSVALGHQRAETKDPQGWRENRVWKLQHQLATGNTGGLRLSDTVGHGSDDFDDKNNILIPKNVRERAMNSVMDMLQKPGTMRVGSRSTSAPLVKGRESDVEGDEATPTGENQQDNTPEPAESSPKASSRKIFNGLVIYINGSTHPLISDHKLKHILVENGARMSIHLGRRQVTHVILGKPSGPNSGAGGGLAGTKLNKEIQRVGGCGVKYVGVEWVMESLKAGRRLPETRFANLKVAAKSQHSVYSKFQKKPLP